MRKDSEEKKMYIVVPPLVTKNELSLYCIDNESRGTTKSEAWEIFLDVSLRKEGYEEDGFSAVEVDEKIAKILNEIDDERKEYLEERR